MINRLSKELGSRKDGRSHGVDEAVGCGKKVLLVWNSPVAGVMEVMAGNGLLLPAVMYRARHAAPEFERHWARFGRADGTSDPIDGMCRKVRGDWECRCPCRGIDRAEWTGDFYVSRGCNVVVVTASPLLSIRMM